MCIELSYVFYYDSVFYIWVLNIYFLIILSNMTLILAPFLGYHNDQNFWNYPTVGALQKTQLVLIGQIQYIHAVRNMFVSVEGQWQSLLACRVCSGVCSGPLRKFCSSVLNGCLALCAVPPESFSVLCAVIFTDNIGMLWGVGSLIRAGQGTGQSPTSIYKRVY